MNIDIPQPILPHSDGRDQEERERKVAEAICERFPTVQVTDDLEALERLIDDDVPALGRFAAVWRDRPSLVAVRARARFHTDELGRLLDQVREGQITVSAEVLSCARALALLIDSANVATMLIAPRDEEDHRALASFRRALLAQARRSRDGALRHQTDAICGGTLVAMSEQNLRPPRLPQASPEGLAAQPGEAAAYPLALAPSLQLWLETGIDPGDLLAGARALLAQVNSWRRVQQRLTDPGLLDAAIRGAMLFAYSWLARLVLWPAHDTDEVSIQRAALDLIAPRHRDPEHLRAAVEWAAARSGHGIGR
ncbi:MAG: hypothetical protein Q8R85_07015 [Bosea sp. (in: a-proteobacteria)]|uniref:hypothetical protein n=1 Tax=Bosea sp. (in: a-proteobacteria) TaxID=1871050 RepID=UPI0027364799|nr:hypothetical protein [Bosea sp. (in: a-proteobacteria)]MDP3600897.1 hypothetical protein [Bosea sp. (in: a-proteobacteria)]